MPIAKFQMPDGRIGRFEVPDGTTPEQAQQMIAAHIGGSEPSPKESSGIGQQVGNLAAGFVRGAGSIGSTILAPYDMAKDALEGKGLSLESNRERRKQIDEGLRTMGAQPESFAYQAGKVGGEIAGTAGMPGVLAKGATALKASPAIVEALRTGGLTAQAALPTRVAAGALTGASAAGLANPEEAGTGAMIGGAIPAAAAGAKGLATALRKGIGATTGVGDETLSQAFQAGKAGGQQGATFKESMRGQSNIDDVLSSVRQGLDEMGRQKQAAYRSGMANIKSDKSILSFDAIDNAIKDANGISTFKGQVKNPEAVSVLDKIRTQVDAWKKLRPDEYHTPEGLDALKQSISGLIESIPYEQKTARLAAGKVYDSIRGTINQQAPEYAKVMKDYSEASDLIREIEKSLVGGNKATAESSMRKLQSLMRNNVNTSYGYRTQLAKELERASGNDIMAPLAGQALNDWTPRGIQRATAGGGAAAMAMMGHPVSALGMAATSSPRLMGELYYGAGKANSLIGPKLAELLRQGAITGAPIVGTQQ